MWEQVSGGGLFLAEWLRGPTAFGCDVVTVATREENARTKKGKRGEAKKSGGHEGPTGPPLSHRITKCVEDAPFFEKESLFEKQN